MEDCFIQKITSELQTKYKVLHTHTDYKKNMNKIVLQQQCSGRSYMYYKHHEIVYFLLL